MKKRILYLLVFCSANITLLFGQKFIIADDIYYQKGDEEIMEVVVEEEVADTNHNILILDPEVKTYEEGSIIYKNENGENDTIFIFGDPDFYLNPTAQ
ncbi:MAG: hypothetical protein IJW01_03300 [Paludibacteraceae bacterium]|nr:hypothetical protein [Paludibacteraceae bacterium]